MGRQVHFCGMNFYIHTCPERMYDGASNCVFVHKWVDVRMDARSKIKFVSMLEAANLLNHVERKYCVHLFHRDRERSQSFRKFYNSIREYPKNFFEYYQMSITSFDELLELLRPYITKKNMYTWNVISAEERLTITLGWVEIKHASCSDAPLQIHIGDLLYPLSVFTAACCGKSLYDTIQLVLGDGRKLSIIFTIDSFGKFIDSFDSIIDSFYIKSSNGNGPSPPTKKHFFTYFLREWYYLWKNCYMRNYSKPHFP